jgi:tetratricopeptide (TPR) repeat protein
MNNFKFGRMFHAVVYIFIFILAVTLSSTNVCLAQAHPGTARSNYTVSVQDLKMAGKGHAAFDKGSHMLEKGETAKSIAYLEEAIAEYPEHYKAYYDLGVAHFRLSHLTEAEQAFQKAIDLTKGNFAPPQFGLGAVLCHKAQFPEAETLLQRALDLEPGSAIGKYYLAWAQFGLNRLNEAERSLEQALLRNDALAEAYLLLARIHQRQRNVPALQKDLEFYVKTEPRKEYARNLAEQIERQTAQVATVVATAQP